MRLINELFLHFSANAKEGSFFSNNKKEVLKKNCDI